MRSASNAGCVSAPNCDLPASSSFFFTRVALRPGVARTAAMTLSRLSPLTDVLGLTGPIDSDRAHAIVNAYTLAFFDRYLKDQPAPLLAEPSPEYPEVLFERR